MRRLKRERGDAIPLFAGVDLMLQELSQLGVVLAMVSSDSESNVRTALGKNAELMSEFACGASLFGKAAKFKAVLNRTGIAAADAICIGDEVRDGEAARQAGIDFGAVSWGFASTEALRQTSPVLVFDSVEAIAQTYLAGLRLEGFFAGFHQVRHSGCILPPSPAAARAPRYR